MKVIKWKIVESSNIKAYSYDKPNLFISFKNGSIYRYDDIDKSLIKEFEKADSKGRFLNKEIKGKYEFEKLEN